MDRIRRGDIYLADLSPAIGSEQGGKRPVLIVQNDTGNRFSTTVIVLAITAQIDKAKLPTHVEVSTRTGLDRNSVILAEQIRTLDKQRLRKKITTLDTTLMKIVDKAICKSIGLTPYSY